MRLLSLEMSGAKSANFNRLGDKGTPRYRIGNIPDLKGRQLRITALVSSGTLPKISHSSPSSFRGQIDFEIIEKLS